MSTCARELWAKKTGYNAVQIVEASATSAFATNAASRNTPISVKAEIARVATRVTTGWKPASFQAAASHAITSGGCALLTVDCGIKLPCRNKSRAAGT